MSRERSDHEPPPGLRSPLYGTATFTTLSNSRSNSPVPMSPSTYSSRLSYPHSHQSRSDDRDMRRLVLSPTPSSFDSRRNSSEDSYSNDGESSFDDRAEVEASLAADHVDDEDRQGWSSGYSSSGSHVTGSGSGTGSSSYVGSSTYATEPLNFDRERRVLSVISERTEQSGSSGGSGSNAGGGIFSTLLSRPTSFLSNAAASSADVLRRSLYGQPISPLTHSEVLSSPRSPGSSAHSLPPVIRSESRPATPDRIFRPVPPTGRRVGDLVATFESNLDSPSLQRPIGPRSPSPYSTSRPSSPLKPASQSSFTSYTQCRTGTGIGLGINTATPSQTISTLLSPPGTQTATSETDRTVRTRSPFTSVRNIVSAWKERTPTRGASTVGSSAVSATTSASGLSLGVGDGVFSLRRRGAITNRAAQRTGDAPPPYEYTGGSSNGNGNGQGQGLDRSSSVRSVSTVQTDSAASIDLSELSSLIRGNEEALRSGYLWYLNVHAPPPYLWQRCQAILYPSTLVLTWVAPGGGRGVVTLDLFNCNEIRSVPAPSHPSARDDVGTIAARLQMDMASRGEHDVSYDLVDMLYPFQLIYSDGVERLGTESAAERVRWVGAIWEAIDRSSTIPDRSITGSPTGSIRTIRSIQSSARSVSENGSGDGSASTIFVANLDLPEIPDFGDSSTFSRTYTQESTTSYATTRTGTYAAGSRLRATDDGAISSRGFLHPLDSRGIEITPSRSGSLRRTSSLTDLDARYAGVVDFGDTSGARERLSARGPLSRFSARWSGTREGSEASYASSSEIGVGDSISQVGAVRRVPASTFYSLSSGSESGSANVSYRTASSTQPLIESTLASVRSPSYTTEEGTEIVASTLSLRRPDEASLLGDSHSGPTASEPRLLSPVTPTRSAASTEVTSPSRSRALSPTSMSYSGYSGSSRTPESLYTTSSGLSRRSEVRRRTPRRSSRTYSSPRTVSSSDRSGTGTAPSESSDKENDPFDSDRSSSKTQSESGAEGSVEIRDRSEWNSLDSRSYTTTTYDSRWLYSSREPTESSERTPSEREPSERWASERALSERESEEEDVFATPTSRSTSYHSAPSPPKTPTPSIPSISTAFDTAEKAPSSTAYESAEIYPMSPPSTGYTTAEICPSSTDFTTAEICPSSPRSTDYMSAECRCIPSEPSLRTEISSLTPSMTLSDLVSEKIISPDGASLYTPSEVPTIPSIIDEAEVPLPVSEDELLSDEPVAPEPSISEPALSTPTSPSVAQIPTPEAPVSEAAPSTPTSGPAVKLPSSEGAISELAVPSTPSSVVVRELSPSVHTRSDGPLSSPSSVAVRQLAASVHTYSERGISSPSSGTTPIITSEVPSTPFIESPSAPSLLSSVSSIPVESTSSVSPTSESDVTPIPSTLTLETPTPSELTASPSVRPISVELPSLPSFLSSPTTPSSPSEISLIHSESDRTPMSKSIYVPSHTSGPTVPSISEYDSSVLAPSPSLHSLPTPEPVDVSFETSFLRPSGSEVFSEQVPSPFWPKEPQVWKQPEVSLAPSTTETPSSISIGTTSFGPTVTVTRTPSTVSSVSVESYRSSILYPKSIWEEELSSPSTEPTLLSSRPTTPRPVSPRSVPIPPSPSTTPFISTPEPTASVSVSTPRSEMPSIHSLTTAPSEEPPEDPFDRLFNLLDDLDAKRQGENQNLKDHIRDLENCLKDLCDHLKKPPVPVKDRSIGGLSPISVTRPAGPRQLSVRSLSPPPLLPSPTYAPSSLTETISYLPSAHSDDDILDDYGSEITYPGLASPTSPSWPSESSPPTSPPSSSTPSSPVPSTVTDATARPISDHVTPALDGLRDLLEDLRRQVQALWDGQLGTNRMLDDLVDRRLPPDRNEDLNNRLRNIEDTLANILRDLARGILPEESVLSPSEISSDTASALRRYIDRLRDARAREPTLHMPSPVRAPTSSIDAEWLRFLSEAPSLPEQPVQGPPPLVPLVRRSVRPPRAESATPPLASILSPPRALTAPLDQRERVRYGDLPRPRRGRPWPAPRIGQGIRPVTPLSELSSFYEPGEAPVPSRRRMRPEQDIDFLRRLNDLRRQRQGGDGFFDGQQPAAEQQMEDRRPVRTHSAPPDQPITVPFVPGGRRPDTTLADTGLAPGGAPGPVPTMQQPIHMPTAGGIVPGGVLPPFPEMLDLLRQNRLAQTASIDQQREIMRYMRSLNDWLGRDVRDRQNEMQAISARVDALRSDLARLGLLGGGAMPTTQVQPQGPTGPTYIVPPMPGPQPGVVPPMPGIGMPQPGIPFSPLPHGFQPTQPGVIPAFDPAVTPPFVPPGPAPGLQGRVVPNFGAYQPQPGVVPGPMFDPGLRPPEPPFIPPPLSGGPFVVQPSGGHVPIHPSDESGTPSGTPTGTYSDESRTPEIHVHHPPPVPAVPPPQVERYDEGHPVPMQPSMIGVPPFQPQPAVVIQPPMQPPMQPPAPTQIIVPSPGMTHPSPSHVPTVMVPVSGRRSRSSSRSPPPVIVHQQPEHREPVVVVTDRGRRGSRSHSRSRSSSPRIIAVPSRGRSQSPRRTVIEGDYGRTPPAHTVLIPSRRTPSPPQIVMEPHPHGPPVIVQQPTSYTPSQVPVVLPQPTQPPPQQPVIISQPSERYPDRPIILEDRRSPSPPTVIRQPSRYSPSRTHRSSSPYRDPTYVISPSGRPERLGDEGRHVLERPRSSSPRPIVIQPPSRSPSRLSRYGDEGSPVIIHQTPSSRFREPERLPSIHPSRRDYSPPYAEGDRPSGSPHRTPSSRHPELERMPSTRTSRRDRSPPYEGQPYRTPSHRPRSPVMEYAEDDAAIPRPVRPRSQSPTIIRMGSPAPTTVLVRPPTTTPMAPTYAGPETIHPESPPPVVIRRSPSPSPMIPVQHGLPPSHIETPAPSIVHLPEPSTPYRATTHPTEAQYSPPRSLREEYPSIAPHRAPSGVAPIPHPSERPVSPRTTLRDQLARARPDEPVVPFYPSQPQTEPRTAYEPSAYPPTHAEEAYPAGEGIPTVSRVPPTPPTADYPPPRVPSVPPPRAPSGPGDLAFYDALNERQQRLEEHEQRLQELERTAEDAEERREQYFRAHEEERERIFEEHEDRRDQEAETRRDEIMETLLDRPGLPVAPPVQIGSAPEVVSTEGPTVEEGEVASVVSGVSSAALPTPVPVVTPVPMPTGPVVATLDPDMQDQMQGLMEMMRQCMAESNEAKMAAADRQEDIEAAVARAKDECNEHLRSKDEEIARGREELDRVLEELNRAREELELERGQRRNEELERIERERADVLERDEAVRAQLSDITNLVQEQREEMVHKRELMDERHNEMLAFRELKQAREDEIYEMLNRILQDREREREEREAERAANEARPTIEQVLEQLRDQGERMQASIDSLAETWRADSNRQHVETIEAVRATAQEMVPYNLTGYLDEFSRALAGEVRTLIGEVGRLHEQKRTLQHGIAELFHMQSQYGPGGQFEPDWHASQGPLAPPPPGPEAPPPPMEEPQAPPPARPAWRTVQQRQPRRQRTRRSEAPTAAPPPEPELAPPQERQQSWATWQPNPAFQPTPPPANSSPLLVAPPAGPQGLFGPRSPRNTQHYG